MALKMLVPEEFRPTTKNSTGLRLGPPTGAWGWNSPATGDKARRSTSER
jgi:hypothetical protein